jgi:hypothetical protein
VRRALRDDGVQRLRVADDPSPQDQAFVFQPLGQQDALLTPARHRRAPLRFRTAQTQHRVRQSPQPTCRDRVAADVTHPIAAVIELGHGTLGSRQHSLKGISDADIGQPAHRLGGAIPHPFAEPQRAPTLRTAGERRQTLTCGITTSLEVPSNRV